jgi:complement component 5
MDLNCFDTQVQVKDSLDQLVGGVPVTLNAQTVDINQETSDLESQRSVSHLNDGVAAFVVNLPSGVTALEFYVSRIFLLHFLGQCVLLAICFG